MNDETRTEPWDVVVAGAGAAGLVAALRAAELGRSVLLLEKNKRPGIKILMSGGTRCNLTHATDNRGIVEAYGLPGRFLHSALAALGVEATIAMFEAEGIATKVEETGKVFPESDKAADVLDALLARFSRSGATMSLGEPLMQLERAGDCFRLATPRQTVLARSVVLTTGGQSYPGSGTTGDGYRFAAQFGHTIVPPRPALVPLTTTAPWVLDLRGVTLPDVVLTVLDGDGRPLASRRSSLLFAHFGLTGPAALDVSRAVSGHPWPGTLVAQIDLSPQQRESQLLEWLRAESAASGKKQVSALVGQLLPRRLAEIALEQSSVPADRKAAELSKADRGRLAHMLKHLSVPLSGTLGFKKAEVTAGGVSLDEVDSRTMQSKLAPQLFFAGELLDLDGPIGGYNFQAAWSTGWLAGGNV
ncbi:MAG TPA: aminoacetone oxidase family FAD-binding enzyme [Pirellulales bacterium]|nr:aminoacetone oxidase family FAD-binding enzyme [Pirellulales bacterium]